MQKYPKAATAQLYYRPIQKVQVLEASPAQTNAIQPMLSRIRPQISTMAAVKVL